MDAPGEPETPSAGPDVQPGRSETAVPELAPSDPAEGGRTRDRTGGPSRLPLVLSTVLAVGVLGAALVAPLIDRALHGEEEAQRALDLAAVQTFDVTAREHTEGDVAYEQDPPVGGAHAPVWLDCGVYDEPVREENAVHDLEHGTIWITHDPSLSSDDLATLSDALPDNGIMSPREDLPAPVVITVWGAQLLLDGADDPRLALFLEEYGDGHTAPELGVSCAGGTPDPQGRIPGQGANA